MGIEMPDSSEYKEESNPEQEEGSEIKDYIEEKELKDELEKAKDPQCSIAVVIPTLNEESSVEGVLESLAKQELDDKKVFEVIVVDTGSTDGTETVVKKFAADHPEISIHFTTTSKQTVGAGREKGMDQALVRGNKYIACTDADAEVPSKWIAGLLSEMEDGGVEMISGKVKNKSELSPDIKNLVDKLYRYETLSAQLRATTETSEDINTPPNIIPGANFATSSRSYAGAGGMRPHSSGEINDLVKRAEEEDKIYLEMQDPEMTVTVATRETETGGQGTMIKKAREAIERNPSQPELLVLDPSRTTERLAEIKRIGDILEKTFSGESLEQEEAEYLEGIIGLSMEEIKSMDSLKDAEEEFKPKVKDFLEKKYQTDIDSAITYLENKLSNQNQGKSQAEIDQAKIAQAKIAQAKTAQAKIAQVRAELKRL